MTAGGVGGTMVKHLVFWRLKGNALGATKAENALRIKREAEALSDVVPGVRHLEVGIDIEGSSAAWDIALYSEFDSREALDAYQAHPEHIKVRDLVVEATC
jgi:hypothetical protein